MPSTADILVAAARVNFGRPKDERAAGLMRRWLNSGCRDWRRETGGDIVDSDVVVSAVFAMPIKAQNLRVQIAKNVRRWGFIRKEHATANLQFMTIDQYMEGPTGDLVRSRVRDLLQGATRKHHERLEFLNKVRQARQAEKAAKLRQTRLRNSAPELRLVLKGLWLNAGNERQQVVRSNGWHSFRSDPAKKLRRLSRNVDFEEKDNYTEEGEPIWDRIDAR